MEEPNYWKRLARRRVSRRQLLGAGAAAALGTATAAVLGCGGGEKQAGQSPTPRGSPAAAGTPRAGGNLTWGLGVGITGIDPHIDIPGLIIVPYLYSYLYSWLSTPELAVTNNLIESMEIVDPLHFNFKLRQGVKAWPVGPAADEEMTSADCKASFERRGTAITAPDKRFPQRIERMETPDPYTFNIVMKQPFVPAIREMANPTWAVVPSKVLDQYGVSGLSQTAFGSGPFMLEEFRGSERIVLKRHPNYFLSPRPYLDGIDFIVITENSSLLAAFKSGQHDVNGATLTKADAEDLTKDADFTVEKSPSLFYPVVHMKMKPPFNDVRVREAVDLALNRDEFIAVINSGEGNYNGPIQWAQLKWALPQEEIRAAYPYDPDRARQLLQEAGYGNGFTAKMKFPKLTGPSIVGDTALLVIDQLKRVGINFEPDEVELGAFISSTLLNGNFDVAFFPNLPYDEPDRPLSFYHSRGVSGTGNWTNYSNGDLDRLINAQSEEFDEARRKEIILEAQRLILKEHGPQLTLTGGYGYQASWNYVSFGPGTDEQPDPNAGPFGSDIWVNKA